MREWGLQCLGRVVLCIHQRGYWRESRKYHHKYWSLYCLLDFSLVPLSTSADRCSSYLFRCVCKSVFPLPSLFPFNPDAQYPPLSLLLAICVHAIGLHQSIAIMSTDQISYAPMAAPVKQIATHPLCPITAAEIKQSVDLIRSLYPAKTDFVFKAITLEEPQKAQLVPYLDAEHSGRKLPHIDRKTFVCYYLRNTVSRTGQETLLGYAFSTTN